MVGRGDNTVDAVHVDDVAKLVARVLRSATSIGRVYNVNHPNNPTWSDFVAQAAAAIGVERPAGKLPYPVAFAAAALMELVAAATGRSPRLTRYSVRMIGRQYRYAVDRVREDLAFSPRIALTKDRIADVTCTA